jgi:hypothetical protein
MMEAVHTSETSVYFSQSARCYILEICNLHSRRRENLTFHNIENELREYVWSMRVEFIWLGIGTNDGFLQTQH